MCKARKAAALAASQSPDDPAAAAQIEREKQEEERAIKAVCDELGLEMWEVSRMTSCTSNLQTDSLHEDQPRWTLLVLRCGRSTPSPPQDTSRIRSLPDHSRRCSRLHVRPPRRLPPIPSLRRWRRRPWRNRRRTHERQAICQLLLYNTEHGDVGR